MLLVNRWSITATCDREGCHKHQRIRFTPPVQTEDVTALSEDLMRSLGWMTDGLNLYCPVHKEEWQRMRAENPLPSLPSLHQ